MKKIVCSLVLIIYFFQSHGQITFNKTYNDNIDASFNVLQLSDSSYLIAQFAGFPINPASCVIKHISSYGNTLWEKFYGDSDEQHISYPLITTYDGNFITGAYDNNFIQNIRYAYLLKFDINGDSLWTKKYKAPSGFHYNCNYLIETSDKGILITGQIVDTNIVDGDLFILKTDSLGNKLWENKFVGSRFDAGYSSIELPDKGFLTLGWTRSFGFGNSTNRDYYLVKTDSLGNFKWRKTYGTQYNDTPKGITATNDGNYLLAGGQALDFVSNSQGNIIKIDTAGNIIWQKLYGAANIDEFWWARELDNGNIAAVGSRRNPISLKDEGWIVCTDSLGNQLWERSFAMGSDYAYFRDFKQTNDGGFICAGFGFEGASGGQDAWLVKLDSLGCDSVDCAIYTGIEESNQVVSENNSLHIFPNPAKELLTIDFTRMPFTIAKISIFNTLGQQVLLRKEFVRDFLTIDISKLSTGMYTVMAEYEGLREMAKFVKR